VIEADHIETLVKEVIEGTELFIVELSVSNNKIKIVLDSDDRVSIKDCIRVSRNVENQLDRDEHDFSLEVTSAGVGQPLRLLRQYEKYLGKDVEVVDVNGVTKKGILLSADQKTITFEEENNKRNSDRLVTTLALNKIKETKAIVSFKHN